MEGYGYVETIKAQSISVWKSINTLFLSPMICFLPLKGGSGSQSWTCHKHTNRLGWRKTSALTINPHQGLYQYTYPFGIASIPAIFQRAMDTILHGIPHTVFDIDDILVTGATEKNIFRTWRKSSGAFDTMVSE